MAAFDDIRIDTARLILRPPRVEDLDGVKFRFADGWLMFRPSGTEPVVRAIAESPDPAEARALVEHVLAPGGEPLCDLHELCGRARSDQGVPVHGRGDGSLVTAVGGQFTATLVASSDAGPFADVTPEQTDQMFGVHHSETEAYAVGMLSSVLHQKGEGAWKHEDTDLTLFYDLHGVWIDPEGGVWAAGGQVVSPPYGEGALIYKGKRAPSEYSQ